MSLISISNKIIEQNIDQYIDQDIDQDIEQNINQQSTKVNNIKKTTISNTKSLCKNYKLLYVIFSCVLIICGLIILAIIG